MRREQFKVMLLAVVSALIITSCGNKRQTDDIIATKAEKPQPKAPISMQEYKQTKDIQWLGKSYQVEVARRANPQLPMVKDETGQKFVDNTISVRIVRADGSAFFEREFSKAAFDQYLDNDYRQTGILEGLVFDRQDGNTLFFAASVSHPQTDEYIPLVVSVNNLGEVSIKPDTQLDTNGEEE